jgi:hypothetical protein
MDQSSSPIAPKDEFPAILTDKLSRNFKPKESTLFSLSSIVLLGNFNPAIFHPEWFERFKILPSQEIQWAEGNKPKISELQSKGGKIRMEEVPPILVRPDRAILMFPSLKIDVKPGKYECITEQRKDFSTLKDVTVKILTILPHTPVDWLGINFHGHWKFNRDAKEILKSLFAKNNEEVFKNAMGVDYRVEGKIISDRRKAKITIGFAPSDKIEAGLFFNANFHRAIETRRAEEAMQLIQEYYDMDLEDVLDILKKLVGEPEKTWTPKIQE